MATSIRLIRKRKKAIEEIETFEDFCRVISMEELKVYACANRPKYDTYKIPKKVGFRLIEDPEDNLKYIQRELNDYLQADYYYKRPANVFGFCISSTSEIERNAITNAKEHIGCVSMLNADMKDFFHQIKKKDIHRLFKSVFINANPQLMSTMTSLATYKGRLPMGAPTSPVLSNYAMIGLDHELDQICKTFDVKYTRYADDLTFSSEAPVLEPYLKNMIFDAIKHSRFELNPSKIKYYDQTQQKSVTGIVVLDDKVVLPDDYLKMLRQEVVIYANLLTAEARYQTGMSHKKLTLFEQEIEGKINFATMVEQKNSELNEIIDVYHKAQNDNGDVSFSWLDVPYKI